MPLFLYALMKKLANRANPAIILTPEHERIPLDPWIFFYQSSKSPVSRPRSPVSLYNTFLVFSITFSITSGMFSPITLPLSGWLLVWLLLCTSALSYPCSSAASM